MKTDPATPETLAREITQGRWLIVADTLEAPAPSPAGALWQWPRIWTISARNWRRVALCGVIAGSLSLLVSLLIPNRYIAATQLLPPHPTQSAAAAFLGQFSELATLAGGGDMVRNPSGLFVALLRSRTVADRLISRLNLQQEYRTRRLSDCRTKLEKRTQIEPTREGVIVIQTEDRDPRRAAALANAYVEELVRMNQTLAVTEAARRRSFFESQVEETRQQLAHAEDALRQAQETTGMVQLDAQAKAMIESAALLRARIALKQSQAETMRSFATEQNPDLVRVERELGALKNQLRQMQQSSAPDDLEVPLSQLPAAGLEYLRRLRDVKYYEAVFEMLSKQLEAARIDEAREGTLIQVIDPAEVPDHKSGPPRRLITLVGTACGLLAGFAWSAARDGAWRAGFLKQDGSAETAANGVADGSQENHDGANPL